jgi:hypothetical protein
MYSHSLKFSDNDIFCNSSILQMAAAASSEMLVPICQIIQHQIPEGSILHCYQRENITFQMV